MTTIYYNDTPIASRYGERHHHYAHNDKVTTAADLITDNADDPQVVRAVLDLVEGKKATVEMGGGAAPLTVLSINPSPHLTTAGWPWSSAFKTLRAVADLMDLNIFDVNLQNEGKAGYMMRVDRGRTSRVAFVTDWDGCYKVGLYDSWDHYQAAGVVEGVEVPGGADFDFSQPDEARRLISAWLLGEDDVVEEILSPPRFVYEIEAVMTCNVTVRIEGPMTEEQARAAVSECLSGYGSGSSAEFEFDTYMEQPCEAWVTDVEVWQGIQDMDTISAEEA